MLEVPISDKNPAIEKDNSKCIKCGYCMHVCHDEITVAKMYDLDKVKEPICINCGQCTNMCPTEALQEKIHYWKILELLKNKKKILTISIAPAVRVALGEEFALEQQNLAGKIVTALKEIGFDYVFDITFGADLTIVEEAYELVKKIKNKESLPLFTSCCPAWVKYAEIFYPEILPYLSTCKSPIAMQSTIIKTYFARQEKINPQDIINIVVAPCTAKKAEAKRKELNRAKNYVNSSSLVDTDYVLTTRELAILLKKYDVDFNCLKETNFDSPLGKGSSAGLLFGNSGGVCEAVLRTSYYYLTGKNLKEEDLIIKEARGIKEIKEIFFNIDDVKIKGVVVNGIKNAKILIDKVLNKECNYDFIEVMSCYGGCVDGGGQPKITLLNKQKIRKKRMQAIYDEDNISTNRLCHENPEIKIIYEEYLDMPNSPLAQQLLHTRYMDKSYMLGGIVDESAN